MALLTYFVPLVHDICLSFPRVIAVTEFSTDTDAKQGVTWLNTPDSDFFSTPLCHGGANTEMSVVTIWKSDVYHLLPNVSCVHISYNQIFSIRDFVILFFL
jgi:hypothetical protein